MTQGTLEGLPGLAPQPGGAVALTSWRSAAGATRIASAGDDGTVRIWDGEDGARVGSPLTGHNAGLWALTSWQVRDGSTQLASGGDDGTVRIWDPESGAVVGEPLRGHDAGVWALTSWQTTDGSARIASAGEDNTIRIWDTATGAPVGAPLTGHDAGIWALTSWRAADGSTRIASAGDDGTVRIWDATTGTALARPLTGHEGRVLAVTAWVSDGGPVRIASGGADGHLRVWDDDGSLLLTTRPVGTWIMALTSWCGHDGTVRIASAHYDRTVRLWDADTGGQVHDPLLGHRAGVMALTSWSRPAGTPRFASASDDGTIRIWDAESAAPLGEPLDGHTASIQALTSWFGHDGGARIVSGHADGLLHIWDADTGAPRREAVNAHTGWIRALTHWIAPDGRGRIASASYDGTIRYTDAETGGAVGTPPPMQPGGVLSLATWPASGGARLIATGAYDGTIRVWNIDTGDQYGPDLAGHSAEVQALAHFKGPDGQDWLGSASDDGTVRVWDVEEGTQVGTPLVGHVGGVLAVTAWTSDDGTAGLASAGYDGTVRLWDPYTQTARGAPLTGGSGRIRALTSWALPDGTCRVASAGFDAVVRVWDPATGSQTGLPLVGHTLMVWSLTCWQDHAGACRLVSAGYDGAIRMWDPELGLAIRTIEAGPVTLWGLSDAPAASDLLDRDTLAQAIADQIIRPETPGGADEAGPTVVTVEGPWGCGKSTLMRLVQNKLDERAAVRPEVAARPRRLTVREAVRQLDGKGVPASRRRADSPPPSRIVTAWFNPWAHQSGEQLWAGLTDAIIQAAAQVLCPTEEAWHRYWFSRNIRRIERFALRRSIWRRLLSPVLGVGVGAVVIQLATAVGGSTTTVDTLGLAMTPETLLLCLSAALFAIGIAHTVLRYWWGRATDFLPAALFSGPLLGSGADDNSGAGETAYSFYDPLLRARAGSLYLHQHDVGDVLADLTASGHGLVVFVDDLDRCHASTTAEVFEAVNLFLSGFTHRGDLKARFVIGLDPAVVAAHLDHVHAVLTLDDTVLQSDDATPGWAFLRKLVQLPVTLPQITDEGIGRFVDVVTAGGSAVTRIPSTSDRRVPAPRSVPPAGVRPEPPAATGPPPAGGRGSSDPQLTPALTPSPVQTIPWRAMQSHPQIRDFIAERLASRTDRSIREAKRQLNVWQLYERALAVTHPLSRPAEAMERSRKLIVLAEIITRWPALQGRLYRRVADTRGIDLLANAVTDDASWATAVTTVGLTAPVHAHAIQELRHLLRECDGRAVAAMARLVL
ncbi:MULTISPECIES: P-loop NTPase fold protein [unclassified Streptomyces]|uniref:P-loop NTPase fold protein n=1 Tax=unclassified Streptomyces TaxID=2593676 RepID=UPI0033A4DFD1